MRRWSVRILATVVVTTVLAVALAVTAVVLVQVLTGSLEAAADQDAARRLDQASHLVVNGSGGVPPPGAGGMIVSCAGGGCPAGVGIAADPDVIAAATAPPGWAQGYSTVTTVVGGPAGSVTLQARVSREPVRAALDALRPLLFVGVPALLVLVAALTWLLVGRVLAPVTAIREKFTEITASDLHQRVPVPRARDEVARLALTLNRTLDRLEESVGRHRRFVADAAHELRSPIATLRTRLELGGRQAPDLAAEALVDVDRIQSLAADLLLLARLDAGEPLRRRDTDLGQVAAEAVAEAGMRSGRGVAVHLDVAPDVVVAGSPAHLRRMIGNLADNALRHANSAVTVRVTPSGVVEVIDDGPGIPPADRERVFDRFTRLDEARARDGGGCGLGLAIARDVAAAHGGTLAVADGAGPGACRRADLGPATRRQPAASSTTAQASTSNR